MTPANMDSLYIDQFLSMLLALEARAKADADSG